MKDNARRLILESFAELYSLDDSQSMLQRMPTESEDPTGEKFEEYFSMIQTVFSAGSDDSLSTQDKTALEAQLRLTALRYGYPQGINLQVKNA